MLNKALFSDTHSAKRKKEKNKLSQSVFWSNELPLENGQQNNNKSQKFI